MKLLCLCKRRPQGRDLFSQPFGRFYYLPHMLAERGHDVHLFLLGYRNEPPAYRREGQLHLHAVSAVPWGPWPYWMAVRRLARELKPDWVLGFSDTWYGITAERLARDCGAQSLIDAYDNYESYIPWLKPLHWLWRRALARADMVTAAGPQLADWIRTTAGGRSVEVVPMAADPIFRQLDQRVCRQKLGLPLGATLVGYTGALHPNRGIDLLFKTFEILHDRMPGTELVLSGKLAQGVIIPPGVHWLGYRQAEEVPQVLNSLDLLFVLNKPGAFGDYSYPVKLYEAMACGVPVAAIDVPGTAWVLRKHPECLARAGDALDLARVASEMLNRQRRPLVTDADWSASTDLLERMLSSK